MSKQTKLYNSCCFHDWVNKLTLNNKNTIYTVLLCLYVADPATFLASVFWDLIFLWEQFVYSLMEKNTHFRVCIIT